MQFTLVDCPGHASLIRTIIGGAQIIDVMFLVIDVNKGIQTQTAECLVIGEILTNNMIVVLNKIDLIPEAGRADKIEKVHLSRRVSRIVTCCSELDLSGSIARILTVRLVVCVRYLWRSPQIKKKLRDVFKSTRFGADIPMIPVSASIGAAVPLNVAAAAAAAAAASAPPASVYDVKPLVDHVLSTFRTSVRTASWNGLHVVINA